MLSSTSNREEAVSILRETIKLHPNDTFAGNQLAEALAGSGIPDQLKEAIGILDGMIQNHSTDNPYSHQLLAKLTGKAVDAPSLQLDEAVVLDNEDANDEEFIKNTKVVEGPQLQLSAPSEVSRLADVFRLKFRLAIDSTFAYAQLLAVRQGIWEKENKSLPSFPAAFELALTAEDAESLSRLAREYPQLQALTIVARAALGDKDAMMQTRKALDRAVEAKAGIEKMLAERVGPILRIIEDGKMNAQSQKKSREQVIASLRDINEWAIGGGDWRIAA
jgi:hypothetical protein